MPIVKASVLKGRSLEARAGFAKAVTEAAVTHLGVTEQQVRVLIEEVEPENWFTAGVSKAPSR